MNVDVIVIGLGAMGSAALYQTAKRGATVLGIDQFDPPHTMGSTHGESRVTRLAVGEGAEYMPLVKRTHQLWRELESLSGVPLLHLCGGYILCPVGGGAGWHADGDFVVATAKLASDFGIEHALLDAAEIRRRHPIINLENHFHGYYEPTGGLAEPEAAVRVQLELAQALGATIRPNERVLTIDNNSAGCTVTTTNATYHAAKVVVSAGAWAKDFLPAKQQHLAKVYRQVMYWYEADDLTTFTVANMPFLLWIGDTKEDYFGAFPIAANHRQAVKLLTEQYIDTCDPDSVPRSVTQAEIDEFTARFVPRKLHGLATRCIAAHACLYTVTPDEHFIIDWHPEQQNVLLASPCSGHGFKHSAAIGESIAELLTDGRSQIDLSPFALDRFAA